MCLLALKGSLKVGNWILSRKFYPDDEWPVTKHSFFIWLHPVKTISIAFVWIKKMRLAHNWLGPPDGRSQIGAIQRVSAGLGPSHDFHIPNTTSTLTRRFLSFYPAPGVRVPTAVRMIMVIVTWSARPLNINQNLEILFIWRCLGWVWWARPEKSLKILT